MKIKRFLLPIIALFMLAACEKETIDYPVESDILVSARVENGNVMIDAETEKVYGATQYYIATSDDKTFNTIKIRFTEIHMYGNAQQPGRAIAVINLGKLKKTDYTVKFYSMGKTTEATLEVDNAAELKIKKAGNVRLK